MLEAILPLLNNLTPLGVIALSLVIIYMQMKNQKATDLIAGNHLSGLPEMQATLERIEAKMEKACDSLTYLVAKSNGKSPS